MKRFVAFLGDRFDTSSPVGACAGDFDTLDDLMAASPARVPSEDLAFSDLDVLDTLEGMWLRYERRKGTDGEPYWRAKIKLKLTEGSNHFDNSDDA